MTNTTRRGFLIGAAATIIAAPAIVRATSIMPVHDWQHWTGYSGPTLEDMRRLIECMAEHKALPCHNGNYVAYVHPDYHKRIKRLVKRENLHVLPYYMPSLQS